MTALEQELGRKFDFDACCADDGHNKLCTDFASPSRSFMQADVSGRFVWIHPPHNSPTTFLQRYLECKTQAPHTTAACIVLPKTAWYRAPWTPLLRGMRLMRQFPPGARIFTNFDGATVSVPWETQVWYDAPTQVPHDAPIALDSTPQVSTPGGCAAVAVAHAQPTAQLCAVRTPRSRKEQRAVSRRTARHGRPPDLSMLFCSWICGRPGVVLVDTGASAAFLSYDFAQRAHLPLKPCTLQSVTLADSQATPVLGQVMAPIKLGSYEAQVQAFVMPSVVEGVDLILGDSWLKQAGAVLDYTRMTLRVRTLSGRRATVHPMAKDADCGCPSQYSGATAPSADFSPFTHQQLSTSLPPPVSGTGATQQGEAAPTGACPNPQGPQVLGPQAAQSQGPQVLGPQAAHSQGPQVLGPQAAHSQGPQVLGPRATAAPNPQGLGPATQFRGKGRPGKQKGKSRGEVPVPTGTVASITAKKAHRAMVSGCDHFWVLITEDKGNGGSGVFCSVTDPATAGTNPSTSVPQPSTEAPAPAADPQNDTPPEVKDLLQEFSDVLPADGKLPPGLPTLTYQGEAMRMAPGHKPPFQPPRRLAPKELETCKAQVQELLDKGHIVPSRSPYGAPILFVRKKDGSLRMCCDARAANRLVVRARWPISRLDSTLDSLQGHSWFSTIDLISGYNQIRLAPEDEEKTAFTTPFGHYHWRVLSFGWANAPAIFSEAMARVFEPMLKAGKMICYMDDLAILGRTRQEHLANIREALQIMRAHGLYGNIKKCSWMKRECKFLGHVISADGIRMDPDKIASVVDWPQPKDATQLRQFLGFANFFRKFIRGMASICAPLHDLTHKQVHFADAWTEAHTAAFEALKTALTSPPLLRLPNFEQDFTIISDASLLGTGAVLLQEEQPIAYTSKKFTPAERNWTTTEQECFGVVRALEEWRCYCESDRTTTIITDHNCLVWLPTQANLSRRLARWMEFLSRFSLVWQYRPGRANMADPLSRSPALAVGLAIAWSAMLTRSKTGSLKQTTPGLGRDLPEQPRKRQRAEPKVAPPPARTERQVPDTTARQAPTQGHTTPQPPFLDRIKAAYASDAWLTNPSVQAKFPVSDTGLIMMGTRVYVPDAGTLRSEIILDCHASAYAGHTGMSKTKELVSRHFWWPGLRADVEAHVQRCHSCQVNKASTSAPAGLLQPLEVPTEPWSDVSMDWITDLPRTARGHTSILVFVCKLTKMVHFCPTTDQATSEGWARLFLEHVVKLHGLPRKLISDRDARFTGSFTTELCRLLGTRQALSTSIHPQTDGQTERTNRILEEMLRHYVSAQHDDWDQHLAMCEFGVNNAWQESTKHTPFYLNYGRHPLTPVSHQLPRQAKNPAAQDWLREVHLALSRARQCLYAARDRQKALADRRRRDVNFREGDLVLLNTKNLRVTQGVRKLTPRWVGPFPITALIGPVAARLALPHGWRIHNVFHFSLLKPYQGDGSRKVPQPLFVAQDLAPVWEVEALLAERTVRTGKRVRTQFLIRWAGFQADEDTWEPHANVLDESLIHQLRARVAASGPQWFHEDQSIQCPKSCAKCAAVRKVESQKRSRS